MCGAILLSAPEPARAEVNIAESIEWLAAASDRVVVGRVIALQRSDPAARGKNRGVALATVQVKETLKGTKGTATLCLGLRDVDEQRVEAFRAAAAEFIFFLQASQQSVSFEGRVPSDTEAFRILYSGSDCYLLVPDILFPKSRPTLGR